MALLHETSTTHGIGSYGEESREGDEVGTQALAEHARVEARGVEGAARSARLGGDHGVVGDGVSYGHFVEHLEGNERAPGTGVEREELVP